MTNQPPTSDSSSEKGSPSEGTSDADRLWGRWYSVAWAGIIIGAVVLLELLYAQSPIPPGVDPGDWVMRSYAFVGRPHPPADAIGSPYLYPPLIFLPLGLAFLGTGSPMLTGEIFAGVLLAVYGLSCVYLAQNFLRHNAPRLIFVAFAVLNGLTFSMLFWGGYPNFLGLAIMNVAFVGLLRLVRRASWRDSFLFFGAASVLYLTHSFSFVLLFIGVLGSILFLALADPGRLRRLLRPAVVAGGALLVATIGLYEGASAHLGIQHPSYLYGNPAAYTIDQLGEIFQPMANSPILLPAGPPFYLSNLATFFVLGLGALAVLAGVVLIDRRWNGWITDPIRIVAGWFAATIFLPDLGYLAKIGTDYTRFVYFFPIPAGLLAVLVVERLAESWYETSPAERPDDAAHVRSQPTGVPSAAARRNAFVLSLVIVGVLFLTVTVPVGLQNEAMDTGRSHGSEFVAAADWLAHDPSPGSVLTTESTARWTEAITARGAFDPGPTWLLFEPWQVENSEAAYWSLNAQVAATNNEATFGFSPAGSAGQTSAPLYAPFILGIPEPVFRVLPAGTTVSTSGGSGGSQWNLGDLGANLTAAAGPDRGILWANYSAPTVGLAEQVAPAGSGGLGWINFTLTPVPGSQLTSFELDLANSPTNDPVTHSGQLLPISAAGPDLYWNVSAELGQQPGKTMVSTTVTPSPAPAAVIYGAGPVRNSATLVYSFPAEAGPQTISLEVRTSGTSNPAVHLPGILSTPAFFAAHSIHFVLLPASANFATTIAGFRQGLGFRQVYANSEWIILAD